jgi:hypothetical protein
MKMLIHVANALNEQWTQMCFFVEAKILDKPCGIISRRFRLQDEESHSSEAFYLSWIYETSDPEHMPLSIFSSVVLLDKQSPAFS